MLKYWKSCFVAELVFAITCICLVSALSIAETCVYLFYGKMCSHCAQERPFLQQLKQEIKDLEVHEFEVYFNETNRILWQRICEKYGLKPLAVPMTFVGNHSLIGFAYGSQKICHPKYGVLVGYSEVLREVIQEYAKTGGVECPDKLEVTPARCEGETSHNIPVTPIQNNNTFYLLLALPLIVVLSFFMIKSVKIKKGLVTIPLLLFLPILTYGFTPFQLQDLPLPLLGAILGLLDGGFNPCALSVLFFLIAYLLALGSRKKCLSIGLVYSLMIFITYFSFMYGLLNVLTFIGYMELIKNIVAGGLILLGALQLKDFFFYGKGISLEIPKTAKPVIEKLVKAATIPSALMLGFLISLVEIPCAGAFPFVYTTLLAERNITGIAAAACIAWYNTFFVSPLIFLTLLFYFGMAKVEEAEKSRLKMRKYMRLIAGLVMITLAIAMLMRWL